MTTWLEAREAKRERLRREQRHYTVDLLGPPCDVCGHRIVLALAELGERTHPTCASAEGGRRR